MTLTERPQPWPKGQPYLHLVFAAAGWATWNLALPVGNLTVAVSNSYQAGNNLSTCQQLLTPPVIFQPLKGL